MNESGCVKTVDQQAKYLAAQAKERKKILARMRDLQRVLEKCERRMDVAGNPHLFDKTRGHLAQQHEVHKQFITYIRRSVNNA